MQYFIVYNNISNNNETFISMEKGGLVRDANVEVSHGINRKKPACRAPEKDYEKNT